MEKRHIPHESRCRCNFFLRYLLLLPVVCLLASCHSSKTVTVYYKGIDMLEVARAAIALGVDIDYDDDRDLMIESAKWVGTPYRHGGNNRTGVDCSGLTSQIYLSVYGKKLHRRSIEQFEQDCKKVHKHKLKTGDLVFFATTGKVRKQNINHAGIYLKDNKFIHASSSRGVVVDNLDSKYYREHWVGGGRVK